MSNIKKAFENGKAFIAFITCGDPDLETTAAAVKAAVQNGADLIELGIPFSDPTAEGPVIQGANLRALNGGVTTDKIFAFVKELRRDVKVPMVFMTYANVVFSYGAEKFISTCRDIEIDGLILPDLPFEEKEEFQSLWRIPLTIESDCNKYRKGNNQTDNTRCNSTLSNGCNQQSDNRHSHNKVAKSDYPNRSAPNKLKRMYNLPQH